MMHKKKHAKREESDNGRHLTRQQRERLFVSLVEAGMLVVDDFGRVWRSQRDGLVRAECLSGGYLQVSESIAGRRLGIAAHRLVWAVKRGPIPDGLVVNHLNNNGMDNRPENLELATNAENVRHGVKFRPSREAIVEGVRRKLEEIADERGWAVNGER